MQENNRFFIKNTDELNKNVHKNLSDCQVYISSITNLDSLQYFNSIKRLKIQAMDLLEFNEDLIIDTTNLKYLKNLIDLYIENDDHIVNIDLSNFDNLKTLYISSCHLLKDVTSFNNLKNLQNLVIYDVPNINKDFYDLLINSLDELNLEKILLDINTFTLFDESQLEKLKHHNVYFVEKIGLTDNYIFSFKMMEEFHNRIINIYNQIHKEYKNTYDILFKMYEYVRNTCYDDASLEKRQKYILDGGKIYRNSNRYKSINSSYKALMKKSAVCEGYVNLLKYFYKLENVDLYPVFCDYKESSHVAAKAFINGLELYFDPELDHRFNNYNNFMIGINDFLNNHKILFYRDDFDTIEKVRNKVRD